MSLDWAEYSTRFDEYGPPRMAVATSRDASLPVICLTLDSRLSTDGCLGFATPNLPCHMTTVCAKQSKRKRGGGGPVPVLVET